MIVPRTPLHEAAQRAKLVARKGPLAITEFVMVTAKPENAWITLTCCDTTVQLALDVECDIDAEMAFCVEAERFAQSLAVPGDDANLKIDGDTLLMRVGRSKFKLPTLPADQFPTISADATKRADINSDGLPLALKRLIGFVGGGADIRPHCQGVNVDVREGVTTLVGTNGFRLARYRESSGSGTCSVILPVSAAHVAASLGLERLIVRERTALFMGENAQLVARMIDGKLPDITTFFPKGAKKLKVDRSALVDAVNVASGIADTSLKVRTLRIAQKGGALTVEPVVKTGDGQIVIDAEGSDMEEMAFNSEFFRDLFTVSTAEALEFEWDDPSRIAVREGNYHAVAATCRV